MKIDSSIYIAMIIILLLFVPNILFDDIDDMYCGSYGCLKPKQLNDNNDISPIYTRIASRIIPDRDCKDFSSQKAAQSFFNSAGKGDPHRLDLDNDGIACELLP